MKTRLLSSAFLLLLTTMHSCNKTPTQGDPGQAEGSVVTCSDCLLTSIKLTGNLSYQISYNAQRKPLVIRQLLNGQVTKYDSAIYQNSQLLQLRTFTKSYGKGNGFTYTGYTDFEWKENHLIRKSGYDVFTKKRISETKYAYGTNNQLLALTKLNPPVNIPLRYTYSYEGRNVKQVADSANGQLQGFVSAKAYDNHPVYLTDPLLWHLLDIAEPLHYSTNNVTESYTENYIQTGQRRDTIFKTSTHSYAYNNKELPALVTIKSVTRSGSSSNSSSVTIEYGYGNQ